MGEVELAVLASSGATVLVQLMLTDAWHQAKHGVGKLFGRGDQGQAAEIERALDEDQASLAQGGDDPQVLASIHEKWRMRFYDLATQHPDAVVELEPLVADMNSAIESTTVIRDNNFNGPTAVQGSGVQNNRFGV